MEWALYVTMKETLAEVPGVVSPKSRIRLTSGSPSLLQAADCGLAGIIGMLAPPTIRLLFLPGRLGMMEPMTRLALGFEVRGCT